MPSRTLKHTTASVLLAAGSLVAATLPATADAHGGHRAFDRSDDGGLVYVMTNAADGNAILVYQRDRRGRLRALPGATVPTGGRGGSDNAAVDPLGSQNALIYAPEQALLVAVNAGDNTVSVLDASARGPRPRLLQVVDSGGFIPVSVAIHDDLLYVLNAGGSGVVSSFRIDRDGQLELLAQYDLGLSNASTIPFNNILAPGQVGVDRLARRLIVTHAGGGEVLAIDLDEAGVPGGPILRTPAPGVVPFSFGVTANGSILVTEAGSGSLSAFDATPAGLPLEITAASIANGQAASCWVVVHDDGFAFVSNTGSNTLSSYLVSRHGALVTLDPVAATTGGAPTDLTLAGDQHFVYTLDAAGGSISGFRVDGESGALAAVWTQSGLPAGAGLQGIAARDF
ncbi:MAG: beta-propeller fold lactonase family protein [Rhodocyclaceae bacterium]|nr:beta-propeller fold lactonase family protein [Rhodocyclaceae bacterium]